MAKRTIISNSVKCLKCDQVIWSAHRHDFVTCKCGSISVDGGTSYLRRVGNFDKDHCEDLSLVMDDDAIKACIEAIQWAGETGRNELGTTLALLRTLRDYKLLDMEKFT